MLAIGLLTRGFVTGSDARALAVHGFIDNEPAPPVISMDFCPVPIRVGPRGTTGLARVSGSPATIRISNNATIVKKKC